MKKFFISFIFIMMFFIGCDPINNTGDKMSLLPIAVNSNNCPVVPECPICPDPTVCPVYETKTYVQTIVCASDASSVITIIKKVVYKDKSIESIKYIGMINHDGMNPFIIDSTPYEFCHCTIELSGDKLIYKVYNAYNRLISTLEISSGWIEI